MGANFKIETMREKLVEILNKLSDEQLAMVIAGLVEGLPISEEEGKRLLNNLDMASIVATEILARRKGFKVEETDILRIRTHGRFVKNVPLYEYQGNYYVIFEDKTIQIPLKKEEPEKPKKRLGKGGVKLP